MEKSRELAVRFGLSEADIERASLAGLLHDTAKLLPKEDLLRRAEVFGLPITEFHRQSPQTLHPLVGAALVNIELGITDEDILNAIRSHTTGRAGMSVLERIVYVADKIEGRTRDADFISRVEAQMQGNRLDDLDSGLRYILNDTIEFLTQRGQAIHPDTLAARDDLLTKQEDTRC